MSKQLLIMRHAKSSWADPGMTDHQRPLNQRGQRAAPQMANWLAEHDCVPDLILSSTAVRAVQTAKLVVSHCAGLHAEQIHYVDAFYHAPPKVYLENLAEIVEPNIQTVMVVGHNPGLEELVLKLSGEFEAMPTAAIAQLVFEIENWSEVLLRSEVKLLEVVRPKELS